MKNTFPRKFYIPAGATKVTDKASDAVAYIFNDATGRPQVKIFFGEQARPVGFYRFKTEAHRARYVAEAFANRRAWLESRKEYKAKRLASNTLTVGDILVTCWGYDQTNVDFYEVTEVRGQYVIIRAIRSESVETRNMQGKCRPLPGDFKGEPMRKLVQYGDSVKIKSFARARKWNTHEVAGVKMGPAMAWTAYA